MILNTTNEEIKTLATSNSHKKSSEWFSASSEIYTEHGFRHKISLEKSEEMLFNNSVLYPTDILGGVVNWYKNENPNWAAENEDISVNWKHWAETKLEQRYIKIEEELFKSLLDCKKTAVVLESEVAKNYSRLLGTKEGVSLGKELYFRLGIRMSFNGMIPPGVARLEGFKHSGILERWMNLLEIVAGLRESRKSMVVTVTEETVPASASLDGNIIILFSLLAAGLILALLVFWMEMIVNRLKRG